MGYRYCPTCGTEYRAEIDRCSDCLSTLVDEPPAQSSEELEVPEMRVPSPGIDVPELRSLVPVFVSGRLSEAELVRSFLESHDIEARLWSSGLSPWRLEAALTEMTGLANDFNAHRVMVQEVDAEAAALLLDDVEASALQPDDAEASARALDHASPHQGEVPGGGAEEEYGSPRTLLETLRTRWVLVAFAVILLVLILMVGPPN